VKLEENCAPGKENLKKTKAAETEVDLLRRECSNDLKAAK